MLLRKYLPLLAVCSILIPFVIALLFPGTMSIVLLGLWGGVAGVTAMRIAQRKKDTEQASAIRELKQTAMDTLTHHRHDWMNDLQVLYGYIRMGKHERSVQYVERIKERVLEESRVAKLGVPSLVFYLQSFRTCSGDLQLSVHVEDQLQLETAISPEDGESLASAVIEFLDACKHREGRSSWGEVRSLSLYFEMDHEDIVVRIEGDGIPEQSDKLLQLRSIVSNTRVRAEEHPSGHIIRMRMQCQA